jgi:hypothetical protein
MTVDPADEQALVEHAQRLGDVLAEHLPGWVERCIRVRCSQAASPVDGSLVDAAVVEVRHAVSQDEVAALHELLATDIDAQTVAPLSLVRQAVVHPNDALRSLGVAPVSRDGFSVEQFPHDLYDLTPASWADVHPEVHEAGIAWGAAKAFVHLARRRAEGRR